MLTMAALAFVCGAGFGVLATIGGYVVIGWLIDASAHRRDKETSS